jgi:hypothetical protein
MTFCLPDPDRYEWLPPPLSETTIAAIYRRVIASVN